MAGPGVHLLNLRAAVSMTRASLESRGWETESAVGKLSGKSSWRKRTHLEFGRTGRELGTGTPKLKELGWR